MPPVIKTGLFCVDQMIHLEAYELRRDLTPAEQWTYGTPWDTTVKERQEHRDRINAAVDDDLRNVMGRRLIPILTDGRTYQITMKHGDRDVLTESWCVARTLSAEILLTKPAQAEIGECVVFSAIPRAAYMNDQVMYTRETDENRQTKWRAHGRLMWERIA